MKRAKRSKFLPPVQGALGRSEYVNSEEAINLYPRVDPSGRAPITFVGTPGLNRHRTLSGSGPTRAMLIDENLLYILCGSTFFSLAGGYIATLRGTINSGTGFASMATNGLVVVIVDGTQGWVYTISSGAFVQITDADFPSTPVMIGVLDNTFIVVQGGTQRFWTSTDGSTWDAAQFASAETVADDLIGCVVDHQELILPGKESTEIWYNSGGTFTFSRRTVLENGCVSAASIAKIDNSVFWVDNKGIVRRLNSYNDVRISTHAIEYRIGLLSYGEQQAITAFTYSQEGSSFYQLNLPNESLVYDVASERWHTRGYLVASTGLLTRHRAECCALWRGNVVVGDYENSEIYALDLDTFDDDGDELQSILTYRHVNRTGLRVFLNWVQLEIESGVGTQSGQGIDPQVEMRFSGDGGKTWNPWIATDIGEIGKYLTRATWGRVGDAYDPVIQFRVTDPVKRVFANVFAEAEVCTQ